MHRPKPGIKQLLAAAAELRAAGLSWAKVAASLGRSPESLRRQVNRFRTFWNAIYRRAEGDQLRESGAESTAVLRQQLRDEDAKGKRDAARALLTAAGRKRSTRKRGSDSEGQSFDKYCGTVTSDEFLDIESNQPRSAKPPRSSRAGPRRRRP